jgi:5-methylcytosine-specific restriction endonuclease McrA
MKIKKILISSDFKFENKNSEWCVEIKLHLVCSGIKPNKNYKKIKTIQKEKKKILKEILGVVDKRTMPKKPKPKQKICRMCKKIFVAEYPKTLRCEECSKKYFKQYHKKYCKKYLKTEHGKSIYKSNIRKRMSRLNKITETFTLYEWGKMLKLSNGICPGYECNPHFVGIENLTLDHIYPVSKAEEGRVYTINDIQPLCRKCNSKKGDKIH